MMKHAAWVAYPKEDGTIRIERTVGVVPDVFDALRPSPRRVLGWVLGFSLGLAISGLLSLLL